jgi:hypothetical protein
VSIVLATRSDDPIYPLSETDRFLSTNVLERTLILLPIYTVALVTDKAWLMHSKPFVDTSAPNKVELRADKEDPPMISPLTDNFSDNTEGLVTEIPASDSMNPVPVTERCVVATVPPEDNNVAA